MRSATTLLLLVLSGCLPTVSGTGGTGGGGGSAGSDGGSDAGSDAGVDAGSDAGAGGGGGFVTDAGAVTGHRDLYYRLETGEVRQPGTIPVSLLVLLDGGFITLTATNAGDGGFSFSNVPPGDHYVRYGSTWVVTGERDINLEDRSRFGRPNLAASPLFAPVSISATGLSPSAFPLIYLATPSTGLVGGLLLNQQTDGGTELIAAGATIAFASGALPDGIAADPSYFWQFSERDAGYTSAVAAGTASGLLVRSDGGTISVALSQPGPRLLEGTFKSSGFTQWTTALHPLAAARSFTVAVSPVPQPAGAPEISAPQQSQRQLLELRIAPAPSADLPFSVDYVTPFPDAGWGHLVSYSVGFSAPTLLAGTTSGGIEGRITEVRSQPLALVTARISPPQGLEIDGVLASNPGTFTSLTPTLRWSAPGLGAPSGYRVTINALSLDMTRTGSFVQATLLTRATQLRLPPGALLPARVWVIQVTALQTPAVDWRTNPLGYAAAADRSEADTLSAIWTTP